MEGPSYDADLREWTEPFCPYCVCHLVGFGEVWGMKTLKIWYQNLVELAKKEGLLWLISNDPEDHREGHEYGNTPEEELDEQKYAAQ